MNERALAVTRARARPTSTSVRGGWLQRCATGDTALHAVPPVVYEALRSPGQPLDAETRALMESRLGHDFANVRVHADARAAESARAVHALAYTVGRDIVFGSGRYLPKTTEGRRLLAHELTHVVQRRQASDVHSSSLIGERGDAYERQADLAALAVGGRGLSQPTVAPSAGPLPLISRQADDQATQDADNQTTPTVAGPTTQTAGNPVAAPAGAWTLDEVSIALRSPNAKCMGFLSQATLIMMSSCGPVQACALPNGTFDFQHFFHLDSKPPGPAAPSSVQPKRVSIDADFISSKGGTTFSRHLVDTNPAYVGQGNPLSSTLGTRFSFTTPDSGTLNIQLDLDVIQSGQTFGLSYRDNIPCNVINCV